MLWFLISTVKQSCTTRRRTVCYIHPDIDHFCCSSFIPDVLSFLLISVFFCFKTFFFCNSIIACLLLTNPLSFLYLRIFIWFLFLKVNSTGCRILHYTSFHSTFQKYFCSFFWPHDFWWDIHSHVSHHSSKNIHHFSLGALQVFSFIFGHKQFNYDMYRCGLAGGYLCWDFLSFFNLVLAKDWIFCQIWDVFNLYFFNFFPSAFFFFFLVHS